MVHCLPQRTLDRNKLKRLHRLVSRAVKGGNSRKKKVRRLAKAWYRIRIQERNHLHRLATALVRNHGKWIAVEGIKTQNLTAQGGAHKKGLNRNLLEQNWGTFTHQLSYKAASAGGKLVKVNPKNTTQTCSACGGMPDVKLTLADRDYWCVHCGHHEDRDVNAAKNILLKGYELLDPGGNAPECGQYGLPNGVRWNPSTQNSSNV